MIRSEKGFSLLELSLVMIIMSIITYGSLSAGANFIENKRNSETTNKLNIIEHTLKLYVQTYGHLPCPSGGAISNTDVKFGVGNLIDQGGGVYVCEDTLSNVEDTIGAVTLEVDTFSKGVVPVRDLNLADDMMFDAWGRRITYIVENKFVSPQQFATRPPGSLHIYNSYDVNANPIVDDAIMVIISHGKSGHGAWNKFGTTRINTVSQNTRRDTYNADSIDANNGTAVFLPRILAMGNNFNPSGQGIQSIYDDKVKYKVAWQFEISDSLISANT